MKIIWYSQSVCIVFIPRLEKCSSDRKGRTSSFSFQLFDMLRLIDLYSVLNRLVEERRVCVTVNWGGEGGLFCVCHVSRVSLGFWEAPCMMQHEGLSQCPKGTGWGLTIPLHQRCNGEGYIVPQPAWHLTQFFMRKDIKDPEKSYINYAELKPCDKLFFCL